MSDKTRGLGEAIRRRVLSLLTLRGRRDEVGHTVVDYLNTHRPQRARRLFTDLFARVLVSDSVLLRARRPIPGLVQRVDAAGLWGALNCSAFAELVVSVQETLDASSAGTLVDDVLQSPEARVLRGRMCSEAVRYLSVVLTDGGALNDFLQTLNRRRRAEARTAALHLETVAAVDRAFILFVRDYLENLVACTGCLNDPVAEVGQGALSGTEAEQRAEKLTRAVEDLRGSMVPAHCGSELPLLLPLTILNVGRQYGAVALYIRDVGINSANGKVVAEALLGHFAACVYTVADVLNAALGLNDRRPEAPIRLSRREMVELDAVMDRVALVMPALIVAGVHENHRTEPTFRFIWRDIAHFLGDRLAAGVAQRITAAITARGNAAEDHHDVLWLLRLTWAWHQLARTYDQAFPGVEKWHDHILDDVTLALGQAVQFDDGDSTVGRVGHLLRLNEVAAVFGRRISSALPVTSLDIVRIMADDLEGAVPMSAAERAVVCEFLALMRAETAQSRNWKSCELVRLLKLAEARGL